MFKHYGSITVLAVAGAGFSGLCWATSGSSVNLQQALGESSQAPFVFPVEGITAQADFASTHDFLIDTTAFIDTPNGVRLQLAGAIANTDGSRAGLTKTGTGTLALAGTNTYNGNTRVTAGTLRLEGASAAGSSLRSVELFSGTTLEYAPGAQVNNMLQLWHDEDEAGSAQAAGQGTYSTSAQQAGTPEGLSVRLSVPSGRATQAGSIAAAPGATVNLVKDGAGSLVLSGFTHAPVAAQVREGALAVQAFFGGAVTVEGGATLAGTGTVGRLHARQGGVVSPGMEALAAAGASALSGNAAPQAVPATLSVTGNLVLDDDSQLRLNVWPDGRADKLQVLGTARLGGTLQALAETGDWAPETRYTVVQAQGGLGDSAFQAATTNLAYLTPGLHYDATAAYLTLTRNDRPLDDVLDDPGEDSVGDVIDDAVNDPEDVADVTPEPSDPGVTDEDPPVVVVEPPVVPVVVAPEPEPVMPTPPAEPSPEPVQPEATPETTIYDTVITLTEPQAADTLRTLDGSWQASVQSRLLADTRYLREASLQEWRRIPATLAAGARTWAATYGARATRSAQGDTHGDTRDLGGLALGATWSSAAFANGGRLNLGVVAGAENSRMQRQGAPANASVRSVLAGVGASFTWNDARLVLGALRGWHQLNISRMAWLGNLPQWLSDARRAASQQVFGELRVRLRQAPQWQADAFGRFSWARMRVKAGSESGGLTALSFQESTQQVRLAELGLRLERFWDAPRGRLSLSGEAAWQGARGNLVPENQARFRDSTGQRHFTSQGQPLPRNALNLRLGAQWVVTNTASLSLHYAGQLATRQRDHSAQLLFEWALSL